MSTTQALRTSVPGYAPLDDAPTMARLERIAGDDDGKLRALIRKERRTLYSALRSDGGVVLVSNPHVARYVKRTEPYEHRAIVRVCFEYGSEGARRYESGPPPAQQEIDL